MITRFLSLLSTPILIFLSIPLTLFALLTTTLALITLLFRISIIYLELLLAVIQSFLVPSPPAKPLSLLPSSPLLPAQAPIHHHARRRTSSSSSTTGSLHLTPGAGAGTTTTTTHRLTKPPSLASLLGTTTPRDYESVGGWRLTSADSDEEALWTGINSRLELPALTVPSPNNLTRDGATGGSAARADRYHHRSVTAGNSRRGSTRPGTASGSPELSGAGPAERERRRNNRRKGSSSGGSPEGYFSGLSGVAGEGFRGLCMTATERGEGGKERERENRERERENKERERENRERERENKERERENRGDSRRGSVNLVKVRGE